jgi:GH15 family glucan-1,4-alpha-glucosidase
VIILLAPSQAGRFQDRQKPAHPKLGEQDQLRAACGRREPDQGVWEVRGKPQHYVSSKLMGWVALDRAVETGRDPRRQRSRGDLAGHR